MPKYKVKDGHKFGLLPAGAIVELTEIEAAVHTKHLELVPDAVVSTSVEVNVPVEDFQNIGNITVAPEYKFLTEEEDKPNYASLTVAQLRAELISRGLDTKGTKTELVARLEEDDK